MYLERAIRKRRNLVVQNAADAVKAINEEILEARRLSKSTDGTLNYKVWIVEEFPCFDRGDISLGLEI